MGIADREPAQKMSSFPYQPLCERIFGAILNDVRPSREGAMKELGLRDRFALAALQGLVANGSRPVEKGSASANIAERTAALAYELADAMLAEREKAPRLD